MPSLGLVLNTGNESAPQVAVAGVRKIGTEIDVTTDDVWHFGSCTKAMTVTTIALLIQDGLVAWNSTLQELIGTTKGVQNMLGVYQNVTVDMLSSHTSGITDAALTVEVILALRDLNATAGRVIAGNLTLSARPVAGAVQGTFTYANMNYAILGLIMDIVSSSIAEDVIQSRLWDPLGISRAGWGPNPETSTSSVDNPYPHLANGTLGKAGLPIPVPEYLPMIDRDNPAALNTAARAHMTLADFDAWLRLRLNTTAQDDVGLSPASVTKLHEIAPDTGGYTYGGWFRIPENGGGYILSHDGSNTANYATAWIETHNGWTVAVTTNVGGEASASATWLEGTHKIAEGLLNGRIEFVE